MSLSATDDPPRPSFDSQLSRDMAGYMPARADFMEVSDLQLMCCLLRTNSFVHYSKQPPSFSLSLKLGV